MHANCWPLQRLGAARNGKKQWRLGNAVNVPPEVAVAEHVAAAGRLCSWCEGGSINLLIKAAALDTLARRNLFEDRSDAIRRYLEAQLTLLQDHKVEILSAVRSITPKRLAENIAEILADDFIREAYPRVKESFLLKLAATTGLDFIVRAATIFFTRPYEYRAGWPDLTILDDTGVQFIEVKTTDLLHDSQLRFAREVAAPLGLKCAVIQLYTVE